MYLCIPVCYYMSTYIYVYMFMFTYKDRFISNEKFASLDHFLLPFHVDDTRFFVVDTTSFSRYQFMIYLSYLYFIIHQINVLYLISQVVVATQVVEGAHVTLSRKESALEGPVVVSHTVVVEEAVEVDNHTSETKLF